MEDLHEGEVYDVAIVGAGLSALSLLRSGATALGRSVVVDYQEQAGGLLRYLLPAEGFGEAWELLQDFQPPQGVRLLLQTTAVGLLPASDAGRTHTLVVRRRQGTAHLRAHQVVIACGGLERPREHDAIPGTRPAGVMTPILALQLLARGYLPGRRALVYGASRYALATARRLAEAGMEVLTAAPAGDNGLQARLCGTLQEICGFPRLSAVRLLCDQQTVEVEVDTLVYAAGLLANTHWLKGSGLALTPAGTIVVDAGYRTNIPGIYAIGTVIRPELDHQSSVRMGKEVAALLPGGVS
jgi:thioredoxin reductase